MKLSDFDFDLPEDLIAVRPARPRTAARLLVAEGDAIADAGVSDLPRWLRPGDRLVLNDTRVLPARLSGTRVRATTDGTGRAKVEFTLTEAEPGGTWRALARPLRKLKAGDAIELLAGHRATVTDRGEEDVALRFDCAPDDVPALLDAAGEMPLPPYIAARRAPDAQDRDDYQTVWAARAGAVAAPTASLHFDAELLDRLQAMGVGLTRVTLHVGAGTFLPVKVEDVTTHRMHAEWGEVTPEAAREIAATRAAGGRVIPVGTTALRLIESAVGPEGIAPFLGKTDIFIYPGHRFAVADGLVTNFHLPRSTLMMLVSALMGPGRIRAIYAHAIAARYRFFSYGDASLLLPG